jgi:hypothetical protein
MDKTKRNNRDDDGFHLNEPAPLVAEPRRQSIIVEDAQFAQIRRREQLNKILLVHDPDGSREPLEPNDMALVRQIAREATLTNQVPALRRNAILMLAESLSHENLELMAELALTGEDFYVRSHAMLALGRTGLKIAAPLLRDGLKAEEFHERQAAEAGLLAISRKTGPGTVRVLLEHEKDEVIREVLGRILVRLNQQCPPGKADQQTSSR